jgi:aspartate aminotransferase
MKFSRRIQRIQPSMTLKITALAQELQAKGEDVISFGAGEPDFPTPDYIKDAAIRAIHANQTRYTAVGGTNELKDAIIAKFQRENGLSYQRNQIVASCGAKHSFYNLAQVLWEEGDEVLVPAPYWVSYPDMILLTGAEPVILPTQAGTGFKISPAQLQKAVTPRTRALVLNSPSNPTGAAYSRKELEALAEVCLKNGLLIVADEIYEHILFDGFELVSVATLAPEVQKNCVVINGVSKSYAMTGWRIGYLAGNADIAGEVVKLQGQMTSNPTSIAQAAAASALMGPQDAIQTMNREFQKRRDILLELLGKIPGVTCFKPIGAFYAFPDVSALYGRSHNGKTIQGSVDFAEYLLTQAKVAVVPGEGFGDDKFIRLSFATAPDNIRKGLERIAKAVTLLA